MASDNRMLWIRNLDAAAASAETGTLEAELVSEADVPGVLAYAGNILCAKATFEPNARGLYTYILRMKIARQSAIVEHAEGSANGYFFREGPAGEVVALLSLALQARFYIRAITFGELSERSVLLRTEFSLLRSKFGETIDPVIFSLVARNFYTDVPPVLDLVRSVPERHHLRVATAMNHYARALREVGVDEEMVFVRLVSAVEVAARRQPIPGDPLGEKSLEDLMKLDSLTQAQVAELKKTFAVRRAKSRFVAFLQQYSENFFDNEPREPAHTQVTPETLSAVAGAIYDARSAYLHAGAPMYLSFRLRDQPQWHMDPSLGRTWQNRRFTEDQKLPRSDFFHRLVRHCILNYVRKVASE